MPGPLGYGAKFRKDWFVKASLPPPQHDDAAIHAGPERSHAAALGRDPNDPERKGTPAMAPLYFRRSL
tara:strand:+ start:383 stop:586 length:204 start_codon:yes stop_codon:yes gene_type:complete